MTICVFVVVDIPVEKKNEKKRNVRSSYRLI